MQRWIAKFRYAATGVLLGLRQESSCQVHAIATLAVIVAAVVLHVNVTEAAILALCVAGVWTAELLNAAIERLARALDRPADPQLRDALDLAAGAVLLMAIGAVTAGAFVLGSRAWAAYTFGGG